MEFVKITSMSCTVFVDRIEDAEDLIRDVHFESEWIREERYGQEFIEYAEGDIDKGARHLFRLVEGTCEECGESEPLLLLHSNTEREDYQRLTEYCKKASAEDVDIDSLIKKWRRGYTDDEFDD